MREKEEFRFGITMRETMASGYFELRDTIARDWSEYMDKVFPTAQYLFIPNSGKQAVAYFKKWNLNVLILSGGDDLGISNARDKTERILLQYATDSNIPVIGICRGLQLIHTFFGGTIERGTENFISTHRATKHQILIGDKVLNVNSYHENILDEQSLNSQFNIIAKCTIDQSIEALQSEYILAMMWHPERDTEFSEWNKELILKFLEKSDSIFSFKETIKANEK